ncbi:TetR/AcrR family transcriptional regulator [Nocardia sp. NPDC050710]|uniref:TetR/AcrR family transcriptional regulator n=1 Tax=Nocardia sp. NPDC050710 TaxID=3157220 RepID=UPI0033F32A23
MTPAKRETSVPARRRYAKRLQPADRRQQLLDTALQIVVESGFADVSIAAVAERGGVTRPVVYDSFGSRDEVLHDLIERETTRMREAVVRAVSETDPETPVGADLVPSEALSAGLARFLDEVRAMPDTWRLVYYPIDGVPPILRERVEKAREELSAPLCRAFADWQVDRGGTAGDPVDLDVLVHITQGVIQTAARLILDEPDRFDNTRILALITQLFADQP